MLILMKFKNKYYYHRYTKDVDPGAKKSGVIRLETPAEKNIY